MQIRTFLPSLLVGASLVSPMVAHAFCRTTTVERAAGSCPEICITDGLPLYWPESDPTYVLNERGFPGLDDDATRRALADSFGAWTGASCPSGGGTGLRIQAECGTTKLEVGPVSSEPNDNVIVHFSGDEWVDQGLNPSAYALTAIWYDKRSGRILGADMHFNGGMGQFGVCPESGCESGVVDLRNVATHEAGHFLGLAHSDVALSTMWCSALPGEVEKRTLEADDIDGICDIYPSSFEDGATGDTTPNVDGCVGSSTNGITNGGKSSGDDGCSVVPGPSSRAPTWLLGIGAGLSLLALRRRRSR